MTYQELIVLVTLYLFHRNTETIGAFLEEIVDSLGFDKIDVQKALYGLKRHDLAKCFRRVWQITNSGRELIMERNI